MSFGLDRLTERERQALRLLASGHDGKSIAAALDVSIHTVNERLREARRKMGVSSSREAARLLLASEAPAQVHEKIGHEQIGIGVSPPTDIIGAPAERNAVSRVRFNLFMGIVIVVIAFLAALVAVQPASPPLISEAKPKGSLAALFVKADSPLGLTNGRTQRRVGFRLETSAIGRVTKCEITQSSGVAALDAATCRTLISRSRFVPAMDAAGKPAPGQHNGHIDWDPQPQVGGGGAEGGGGGAAGSAGGQAGAVRAQAEPGPDGCVRLGDDGADDGADDAARRAAGALALVAPDLPPWGGRPVLFTSRPFQ